MIKIGYKNGDQAKIDYVNLILGEVSARLLILRTSLIHIRIKPNKKDLGLQKFKSVTEKIFNYFQPIGQKYPSSDFNKKFYEPNVTQYAADHAGDLLTINFIGLIKLIDRLRANNNKVLGILLSCSPERIYGLNELFMVPFGLNSAVHKFILGLGFDWGVHDEVTDLIKPFIREEIEIVHCPYCNINRAFYSQHDNGKVSSSFPLDHFYSKKDYPLLTFCMYNLVPCDDVCNGPNVKGQIQFFYDYHLNPYESGMDRTRMFFRSNVTKNNEDPSTIELVLVPPPFERKYQQLVGNFPDIDESREVGNINVFNLKKNYNEKFVLKSAGRIQRQCEDIFSTRYSLNRFMTKMKFKLVADAYERFYFDEFGTEFLPGNFNIYNYSKLVRDIHDNVLGRDKSSANKDIKKFVSDNPA